MERKLELHVTMVVVTGSNVIIIQIIMIVGVPQMEIYIVFVYNNKQNYIRLKKTGHLLSNKF